MTCPKLKEPTDLERILAKALCYSLEENRGVVIIEEEYTLIVSMASNGKIQIRDVTKDFNGVTEGTMVEIHENMADAVTAAALRGGEVRES